ncbi:hypothetical protein NE236_01180 [Actinoallomurus purpureus]|uniref:hypothetical protein n=1 Tax=Actinoallomurus purpureus TaxID=478114 RepID=UPI0020936636|nr:hypothetical protein [Actinoallomurus purpureus]MCO6003584.1 hypothetical protein [Actinoallomurus purpureus]
MAENPLTGEWPHGVGSANSNWHPGATDDKNIQVLISGDKMRLRSGVAALAVLVLTAGGILATATAASAAPAPTTALATAPAAQSGGYQAQGRYQKCSNKYTDKYTKFTIKVCITNIDNKYADPSYHVYTKKKYKKPCMTVRLKRNGKVIRSVPYACAPGEYAFGGAYTKGTYQLIISSERFIVAKNSVSSPKVKVN